VSACGGVDWSQVAAEHGYADQAQFIHDFRDLTGIIADRLPAALSRTAQSLARGRLTIFFYNTARRRFTMI
jgi:hypothetical protein